MNESPNDAVRNLFERQTAAVLCTAHRGLDGWPYGSLVPYAMLPNGDLAVFLSDIAEHTHNLLRDARATVFLADPAASDQPQRGPRHAMLVRARQPDGDEETAAEACYFARFPEAEGMRQAHGFRVWLLECERIRWIAGFGGMGWIDRAGWSGTPDPLAEHVAGIVAHLNDDHQDALVLLVSQLAGIELVRVEAVGLDRGGIDLQGADESGKQHALRLPFPTIAVTADEVHHVVVEMVRGARRQSASSAKPEPPQER